jgi:hypothetical protein
MGACAWYEAGVPTRLGAVGVTAPFGATNAVLRSGIDWVSPSCASSRR